MKSLSISERYGFAKYVSHQAYYSLICRDFESELMPLAIDQKVNTIVWSPLGGGRLSGKVRHENPQPEGTRYQQTGGEGPKVPDDLLFQVVDVLGEIAQELNKTIPQVAINWVLQRPTISSVIFGARNEDQLKENLGAVGWNLTPEQVARLDAVSDVPPAYPYWHQRGFAERNPRPV